MPNPFPEIPLQDNRPDVPETIPLAADVAEFVTNYEKGRGDRRHVINAIIRVYRDALPANRRGPLVTAAATPDPATSAQAGGKGPELLKKQAANG